MVCFCECIVSTHLVIKSPTNSSLGGRRLPIQSNPVPVLVSKYIPCTSFGSSCPLVSHICTYDAAGRTISRHSSTSAFQKNTMMLVASYFERNIILFRYFA